MGSQHWVAAEFGMMKLLCVAFFGIEENQEIDFLFYSNSLHPLPACHGFVNWMTWQARQVIAVWCSNHCVFLVYMYVYTYYRISIWIDIAFTVVHLHCTLTTGFPWHQRQSRAIVSTRMPSVCVVFCFIPVWSARFALFAISVYLV